MCDRTASYTQPIEPFCLLELADPVHDSFITANPNAPPSATYGNAGDGMAVRLAEPMAARLTTRLRALAARGAYDSAADDSSFERRAAAHFDVIDDGATYVKLITADAISSLRLLVASDLVSLPRLLVDATGGPARRSVVAACGALANQLLPGERSCSILVHESDFRLVSLPMLHYTATRRTIAYSQWASLNDLAHTPLWRAAVFSFAHLATFMRAEHGRFDKALGRMVGTRRRSSPPASCNTPVHAAARARTLAAAVARARVGRPGRHHAERAYAVRTTRRTSRLRQPEACHHSVSRRRTFRENQPHSVPARPVHRLQASQAHRHPVPVGHQEARQGAARRRHRPGRVAAAPDTPTTPGEAASHRPGRLPARSTRHHLGLGEHMHVGELGPYFVPVDFTATTGTSLNTAFLDTALEHCDD